MKRELKAQELVPWLEKKVAQLEGKAIISQLDGFDQDKQYSRADILNKMYDNGHNRGYIEGARDILLELAQMFEIDKPNELK